jgi:hypothetical protein
MPAVVMLERKGVHDARSRSNALVRGQTRQVLACVIASFVIVIGGSLVILSLNLGFGTRRSRASCGARSPRRSLLTC